MDKKGLIISIIWAIIMGVGIGVGYVAKQITTGEFYICLMMWLYVTVWFIERNGDDKWKK